MLETLDDPDVKRMSFETPESQAPNFDIESEITDEDWEGMVNSAKGSSGMSYIKILANLKVISPSRFQRFSPAKKEMEDARWSLDLEVREATFQDLEQVLGDAVAYKSLGLEINKELMGMMKDISFRFMADQIAQDEISTVTDIMVYMKLLGFEYNLKPELALKLLTDENEYLNRHRMESVKDRIYWQLLLTVTRNLKIFFSEKNFPFTPEEFESIKEQNKIFRMNALQSRNYAKYRVQVAEIKLGLADRIILDHVGLRAIYDNPQSLSGSHPNPPEQRNF